MRSPPPLQGDGGQGERRGSARPRDALSRDAGRERGERQRERRKEIYMYTVYGNNNTVLDLHVAIYEEQ